MDGTAREDLFDKHPLLHRMAAGHEVAWLNPALAPSAAQALAACPLTCDDIDDAARRLERFAPLLARLFPQVAPQAGIIESPLQAVPRMQEALAARHGCDLPGRLYLKRDDLLAVAGSVKARGGIYEVLKHAEGLALEAGLLASGDVAGTGAGSGEAYLRLADPQARELFARHTVQVGSTGNLGLSIGTMAAALGFNAVVHMSADARQWKKDLLRSRGVTVVEYAADYSAAVAEGRRLSDHDPRSHFVDDENSRDLFLGYAVAARRLAAQLAAQGIAVDAAHPLAVYLPCGVGGAPGGIAFGLKHVFGDAAHCFFVEPVEAPCMTLGLLTGLDAAVCVQDVGLSGQTHADGLAVGRPSGFVGQVVRPLLTGCCTVADARLYDLVRELFQTEGAFVEPSAAASLAAPVVLQCTGAPRRCAGDAGCIGWPSGTTHVAWSTGGSLVPADVRAEYLATHLL